MEKPLIDLIWYNAVLINEYAYIVPYVMDGEDYFLKTIIPSRKANRSREEERND